MDEEERDWDTGPFCRHWSDPSDCDIECANCSDPCPKHGAEDGDYSCSECDCKEWVES